MTTVILRKGITQARLDAALAAKKTLTDYANVVVVDSGGNGDYTSLALALAAITDASATNRYVIWVFGRVLETADFVWKDYVDCVGYGAILDAATVKGITFSNTVEVYITGLLINANVQLLINAPVTLRDVRWAIGEVNNVTGVLTLVNTEVVSSDYNLSLTGASAKLRLYNSNLNLGLGAIDLGAGTTLIARGGSVVSTGDVAVSMVYGTGTDPVFDCIGTLFSGINGFSFAKIGGAAISNLRVCHCVLVGTTTGVTFAAGTAAASNIRF